MNLFTGAGQQARQLNPQILLATALVIAVRREIESLLPQALQSGTVAVSESRIRTWQSALQAAATTLNQIPVPLIFPPPAFASFVNGATRQIDQALATLASIPVVAPLIFPPQPGQATLSLETLQFLLNDLQQATVLLVQALQSA